MSIHYKLLIPLLDSNLTKEDLSPEAGFVEAYSNDINKPWLNSQIFLLYEDKDTRASHMRMIHFKECNCVYSTEFVIIESKPYTIYAIALPQKELLSILSNSFILSNEQRLKIGKFWMFSDTEINSYLMNPLYLLERFERKSLPEVEPKGDCLWFGERAGLSVERSVRFFIFCRIPRNIEHFRIL